MRAIFLVSQICMTLFGHWLSFPVPSACRFELYIEQTQGFFNQSERLFFHFFGKATLGEPICGYILVVVAALKQCLQC
jgi:hypothetical protein